VLLAIVALVVIAAAVALLVWVAPLAPSSGVGAEDAAPNAGAGSAAVVHDDAWNMPSNAGAGSAIIHDDAWNLHRSADDVHPWVNLRDDEGNVHRVRAH
jgi:hypothetical protein